MSKIKALKRLREWASQHKGWSLYDIEINEIADEIEHEIAERFIKLPVDADGVPIRVGDKLVIGVLDKITCTVEKLEFDGRDWWYKSGDDCFVCSAAHHVPRTLEDVLRDVGEEALDYAKSYIWRNPDEVFAERANEIRAMFGEIDD